MQIVATLQRIASAFRRAYDAAIGQNHIWNGTGQGRGRSSATPRIDDELAPSIATMRARCRHVYQNTSGGRAIVDGKTALVVSTGIDVEPDTGDEATDTKLREAWLEWVEHADASGIVDFWEMQRQAWRQTEVAGSWLWVFVDLPDSDRPIPAAIMAHEPDILSMVPVQPLDEGNIFSMGVEKNKYCKPMWYHIDQRGLNASSGWAGAPAGPIGGSLLPNSGGVPVTNITPPQTPADGGVYRLPADRVIFGFEQLRPNQTIGEPRLTPSLNTLRQEHRLVEAELVSATQGAAAAVAIKSAGSSGLGGLKDGGTGVDGNGNREFRMEPGMVFTLDPGEDISVVTNDRPSQAIAPFRNMLVGDEAGASGLPQRFINRDVSRANYSSMRADMLDTRRILDPQQGWFGRLSAAQVYTRILPQLCVLANVRPPARGTAAYRRFARLKTLPDGWAYVDPEKDVVASLLAIRGGLSTWRDESAKAGKDYRSTVRQLKTELKDPLLGEVFAADAKPAPAPAAPAAPADATPPGDGSQTTDAATTTDDPAADPATVEK